MKNRHIYFFLFIFMFSISFSGCKNESAVKDERPNIVIILADDMGYSDVGAFGGEIHTPALDNLAQNGLRLTQFYNTAKCFTTRAELMTGLYAYQVDMGTSSGTFAKNNVTIAEALREAGYRTLMSGKWHGKDHPMHRGFDRYYGLRDGAVNFWNPGEKREGEPMPGRKQHMFPRTWCVDSAVYQPYTPEDPDFYATDAYTDRAIEYLETYHDEEKPFFLYLAYTAPHYPLHAWPEDIEKYRGNYMIGWDSLRQQRFQRIKELGLFGEDLVLPEKDPESPAWESLSDSLKDDEDLHMAVYAAMVDRMDQNIARLMEKLNELGEAENTVIMFMSDNGACAESANFTPDIKPGPVESYRSLDLPWAHATNAPFRKYKNHDYEGGICTPFIYYDPRNNHSVGEYIDFPAHIIDLMPTCLELAGGDYPEKYHGNDIPDMEGISILPALARDETEREKPIFFQWSNSQAVRLGDWKLVSYVNEPWDLFNIHEDRTEIHDVSGEHPEMVKKLDSIYHSWAARTGAKPKDETYRLTY